MTQYFSKQRALPVLVALLGIGLSFLAWYWLKHDAMRFSDKGQIESYHPQLAFIICLILTTLFTLTVKMMQVAREKSRHLIKVNEHLKKEIAERTEAVVSKRHLETALQEGQKLQAIGTLAGGISHDFNNILYAMKGYAELAQAEISPESKAYRNLSKVVEAVARGQSLTARILAFSRRQQQHFEAVELNHTIQAVLDLVRPTIPSSVHCEFKPTHDVLIMGNPTQLHQVLVNLINNAVDAMDGEGDLQIKLQPVAENDPALQEFPAVLTQSYCKIEIRDTGHGMDPSTMERIFEPFFTTKEVGKGTGLGLSIVHSIIKEHHGDVSVSSEPKRGTTFCLVLPEYKAS